MPSTTLEDAQAHLAAWIARLGPGEELIIIDKGRPVARLIKVPASNADRSDRLLNEHN
jgi:antitoxin (DNA-binding transcriptional repressor) of toxin-antitoxin stability system